MAKPDEIIECVANISYGTVDENLNKIKRAVETVSGQKLLDIDSSVSANRSVFTFAGKPESVAEAAFRLIKQTASIVNMNYHRGGHPRIGATDVCPFVALQNYSQKQVIQLSIDFAKRVGNYLNIPVYLYELSARKSYRTALPDIRKGGYEGLPKKMLQAKWQPDFGPNFNAETKSSILKTGATVIGARNILVAFNVSLATSSVSIARKIAYRLRTTGWPESMQQEALQSPSYLLPALRAIGWYSSDYSAAQVSFNFLRYQRTSPLEVWEMVKKLAKEYNTTAIGCEVIGLIPEACILDAGIFALQDKSEVHNNFSKNDLINLGVAHFGFNNIRPFDPLHKILEYRLDEL